MLAELLVCPVCHGNLDGLACVSCGRVYRAYEGVADFTPVPPPDPDVAGRWPLWKRLQANSEVAHEAAPELNLAVGGRDDARVFGDLVACDGRVLDVGCGPQRRPSYARRIGELVGIDPLQGEQPRDFAFVRGIGEYLPFRDASFDEVLFATTIDHMLVPARALAEARRVVRPDGRIAIWFGEAETARTTLTRRARRLASRVVRGRREPPPQLSYMELLEVPEGAADHFHFVHLTSELVEEWLRAARLDVTDSTRLTGTNSIVLKAVPASC